jgi:hypothetical protein
MGENDTMRKWLPGATLILIAGCAGHAQPVQPGTSAAPAGWRALFNGKDLDGWEVAGARGTPAYRVEDGAIRTQPGAGVLWYRREKIGNATLRVVYRMSNSQGTSGIFIRIPDEPANDAFALQHGIEVSIDDRGDDWHLTGVLDSLTKALCHAFKPGGEWNTMDITLAGPRTVVKLNGALVTDHVGGSSGARPDFGYIGLLHRDDRAEIWFREISVK